MTALPGERNNAFAMGLTNGTGKRDARTMTVGPVVPPGLKLSKL